MPRAISGIVHKKRVKSTLKKVKGFRGSRSKLFRVAKNAVIKSLQNSYIGRKQRKRQFRNLWIARINAACRNADITYSRFINGLKNVIVPELNSGLIVREIERCANGKTIVHSFSKIGGGEPINPNELLDLVVSLS